MKSADSVRAKLDRKREQMSKTEIQAKVGFELACGSGCMASLLLLACVCLRVIGACTKVSLLGPMPPASTVHCTRQGALSSSELECTPWLFAEQGGPEDGRSALAPSPAFTTAHITEPILLNCSVPPRQNKEDLKTVALGTSKINYLDPRITVAWCGFVTQFGGAAGLDGAREQAAIRHAGTVVLWAAAGSK